MEIVEIFRKVRVPDSENTTRVFVQLCTTHFGAEGIRPCTNQQCHVKQCAKLGQDINLKLLKRPTTDCEANKQLL